ncbi:MAG: Zn-dependent protease [Verrucomicrobiales bacterium]|jgi:Zn-dependent protease
MMNGKWKLGEPFGIGVFLHWSVAILVILFALGGFAGFGLLGGMLLLASLIGSVILHELGHSQAARRYGIQTRDIIIYAIGGVASLERMPKDPKRELVIALAGPMVNVAIAGILAPLIYVTQFLSVETAEFLLALAVINVVLVVFNMIPAFPMDGGRVLRALLSMKQGRIPATNLAAKIGKVIAVIFILLGIFADVSPMLIVIGLFVWSAGETERRMVSAEETPNARGGFNFGRFGPFHFQFRHSAGATKPPPKPAAVAAQSATSSSSSVREADWEVLPPEGPYQFRSDHR